ncbi:hypothetical protein CNR22_15035 [Sphingobacteriaceae bacterium]|nr:hypothetical protein CNR22_15035 [Sphingobacteriaceae bacterium]
MTSALSSGKSFLLRNTQELLLASRTYYLLMPFSQAFHKLHCLLKFIQWKKEFCDATTVQHYKDRYNMYEGICNDEKLDEFSYLEFGVSKGDSIKWWLTKNKNPRSTFFGFDTFIGIPEAWGTKPAGTYTNHGNYPEVNDLRCTFIQGIFQDTLLSFLKTEDLHQRKIIHFDADLYSSTLFCLFAVAPFLKSNDILIFDEFDTTTHEFRAFSDFQTAMPLPVQVIAQSNNYKKIVLKIK